MNRDEIKQQEKEIFEEAKKKDKANRTKIKWMIRIISGVVVVVLSLLWYYSGFIMKSFSTAEKPHKELIFIIDKTEPYTTKSAEWANERIRQEMIDIRDGVWYFSRTNSKVKVTLTYYVLEKIDNHWRKNSIVLSDPDDPLITSDFWGDPTAKDGQPRALKQWIKKNPAYEDFLYKDADLTKVPYLAEESRLLEVLDDITKKKTWKDPDSELLETKIFIFSDLLEFSTGPAGIKDFEALSNDQRWDAFLATDRTVPKLGPRHNVSIMHLMRKDSNENPLPFWQKYFSTANAIYPEIFIQ